MEATRTDAAAEQLVASMLAGCWRPRRRGLRGAKGIKGPVVPVWWVDRNRKKRCKEGAGATPFMPEV